MARCNCGASFSKTRAEPAARLELAVSELMVRAEIGLHGPGYPELLRFPPDLAHCSVQETVQFLHALGRFALLSRGGEAKSPLDSLKPGYRLLEGWPSKLEAEVEYALGQMGAERLSRDLFTYIRQFIKNGIKDGQKPRLIVSFYDLLSTCIQQRSGWVPHFKSARTPFFSADRQWLTRNLFRKLTGVSEEQVDVIAAEYPLETYTEAGKTFFRVPLEYEDLKREFLAVGLTALAARLDVPRAVAEGLVAVGLIGNGTQRRKGFALERDISRFESRLRSFTEEAKPIGGRAGKGARSIRELLWDPKLALKDRVALVGRVLSGDVDVQSGGSTFGAIRVLPDSQLGRRYDLRYESDGANGWVLPRTAADYLGLSQYSIAALVRAGELEACGDLLRGKKIQLASLKDLAARYVTTRAIASVAGVSTVEVGNFLTKAYEPACMMRFGRGVVLVQRSALPEIPALVCQIASAQRAR